MISRTTKVIIAVLIVVFLGGSAALYLVREENIKKVSEIDKNTKQEEKLAMPDLARPIVITDKKIGEGEAKKAKESIIASQNALKEDSDNYQQWLNLALQRKAIGDYEAALEIWKYVTKIRPLSGLAYNNLGNLHIYEFQEVDKAEPYYLKAIELEPNNLQFYLTAYEYYRFVKKDLSKAREILKKGISVNPGQAKVLSNVLSTF